MFSRKRPKSIDPNKLLAQLFLFEAELTVTERKILQLNDTNERSFVSAFKAQNIAKLKESVENVFKYSNQLTLFPIVRSAVKEIKNNSEQISNHSVNLSKHEDAFRTVIITANYFKFESAPNLQNLVQTLYGNDIKIILDSSQLLPQLSKSYSEIIPSNNELNSTIKAICEDKYLDITAIEEFIGDSLTISYANSNFPPNEDSYVSLQTSHINRNPDLYQISSVPIFQKNYWPDIIQAIQIATE